MTRSHHLAFYGNLMAAAKSEGRGTRSLARHDNKRRGGSNRDEHQVHCWLRCDNWLRGDRSPTGLRGTIRTLSRCCIQPVQAQDQPGPAAVDTLTVAAIGVVAYAIATMLHEGIGHVGACVLSGGQPLVVSTVHMECSVDTRLVAAGGTIVNFAAAVLFFAVSRFARRFTSVHFFCWLVMTINLLMGTGYFLFSGVGGFGDWAVFIKGLGPTWLLRLALVLVGALSYLAAARFCLLELRPMIGSDKERRVTRAIHLMRVPYFAGGALACIAGLLNPAGWYLVALSAAASTFGGTSALVWSHNWLKDAGRIPLGSEPNPPAIERSWLWVTLAFVVAIVFIGLIGPGVKLSVPARP